LDAAVRQARKTKVTLAKKKGRKPTKKTAIVIKRGYVSEKTNIPKPTNGLRMERWGVSHQWLAANGNEADFADDEADEHLPPDWAAQGIKVKVKVVEVPEGHGSSLDSSQSDSSEDSNPSSD
jgi:hypothetical protein